MNLEQDVWRSLAQARAYMHEVNPVVEVNDLALMLTSPRAAVEAALQQLEAQGMLLIQWRAGREMGSAFVTQDGLRAWAQMLVAQGEEPLPNFQRCAARIMGCLERQPIWVIEALAADLDVPLAPLMAQVRIMEALGDLHANKRGSGVILSVTLSE